MSTIHTTHRVLRGAFAVAVLLLTAVSVQAGTFSVSLDTTAISGTGGSLLFEVLDGDFVANNTASISGFSTDGILGGTVFTDLGVTGVLPGPVSIPDSAFINDFVQTITFGSGLSFNVDFTNNSAGGFADSFSFGLFTDVCATDPFDFGCLPLIDTDLLGLQLGIDADGSPIQSFFVGTPLPGQPSVMTTVQPTAVPEPGTLWLFGAAACLLATIHRRVSDTGRRCSTATPAGASNRPSRPSCANKPSRIELRLRRIW